MNKQSKDSNTLIIVGSMFCLAGVIAWLLLGMVLPGCERFAIPASAVLAAIGVFLLILNAVIHPESVPRPDVRPPKININLPPEAGGYYRPRTVYTRRHPIIASIINVNEWPIVSGSNSNGEPMTRRQQIRGTISCLLWIATLAVYMLVSFYTGRWEITWIIFLGAAFIHTLIYSLLSIGGQK